MVQPSILIAHNQYRFRGGEDVVVESERDLLRRAGHRAVLYLRRSDEIAHSKGLHAGVLAARATWAVSSGRDIHDLVQRYKPAVVHFHNTFPLISPAAYYATKASRLPVVQTLHNYRLLCANAILYRDGHPCEDCLGRRVSWPAIQHKCYRNSRPATVALAGMMAFHRALATWHRMVDIYICPTRFARQEFAKGGFPEDRILVKPNFVHPDPAVGDHRGRFALFVGRLSAEKGVRVLLESWKALAGRIPLRIVGEGPLSDEVIKLTHAVPSVELLGWRSKPEVINLMREATFLIVPSVCFETFALVVAEAYGTGLPVIASAHGALAELIEPMRTELHHQPGDPDDLAARAEWAWTHPQEMVETGREARLEYERKFTAERNYRTLIEIYDIAISRVKH